MLVSDTDTFAYILPNPDYSCSNRVQQWHIYDDRLCEGRLGSVLIGIAYGILVMAPWYAFLGLPVWDPTAPWPFSVAAQ